MCLQPDGKIIIGGVLITFNGATSRKIARLNTDGSLDVSFNTGTGADDEVWTINLQPDGKIIIGGYFMTYNGTVRNNIARLNADGSLDAGFNPGTGANGYLNTSSIQADGRIIIGGYFTNYNGTARKNIARLNMDGSLDFSFNPGAGANYEVYTNTIQTNSRILIGGIFTSYNGIGRNRISRIEGGSPLVNDDAAGAILMTVGSGCSGSTFQNVGATQSTGEPFAACQGTAGYNTVWYKFTAPSTGNIRISNDFSGGTMGSDTRLALFSATNVNDYSTFTNIACDDDNGVTIPNHSILYATGLTSGNTYYIQVDGKDATAATGTFCLTVDELTSSMISTSTACTTGQPLTLVNNNYPGWLSSTDANGKLIALINNPSGGATTSTYSSGLNINAGPVRADGVSLQKYLDRNFLINNAAVSNVNVRFFFLNSELAALQSADPGVTLANLQATRQTGNTCNNDFVAANGINSSIAQSGNGSGTGFHWIQLTTPGLSKFFLHTKKAHLPLKAFLHGAFNSSLSRHKDVNTTWAAILNAHALNQPYNVAPFNYAGTESVNAGFFTSTAGTTDITDWVLLELRDAVSPSTIITRRVAFIREDGRIVDLDGVSDVSFRNVADGNYHLLISHRNHLNIRTSTARTLNGTMGFAIPAIFDFSTAQSNAYQNPTFPGNGAMSDLGGGLFGMWGGNGNGDALVRSNGPIIQNDYLYLISTVLGGNVILILDNVYNNADLNMDGRVRASGPISQNDYLYLFTNILNGNLIKIIFRHQ